MFLGSTCFSDWISAPFMIGSKIDMLMFLDLRFLPIIFRAQIPVSQTSQFGILINTLAKCIKSDLSPTEVVEVTMHNFFRS